MLRLMELYVLGDKLGRYLHMISSYICCHNSRKRHRVYRKSNIVADNAIFELRSFLGDWQQATDLMYVHDISLITLSCYGYPNRLLCTENNILLSLVQ